VTNTPTLRGVLNLAVSLVADDLWTESRNSADAHDGIPSMQ